MLKVCDIRWETGVRKVSSRVVLCELRLKTGECDGCQTRHYKTVWDCRLFVPSNPNIDIRAQYSDEIKSP